MENTKFDIKVKCDYDMKMPLVNTLITFRILLPICTFYYVSFYSLIYRNKIPWHNQKVRVHFLFSHGKSKWLWHGFWMYIFLWSVVGLVSTTISLSPRLSTKYKRRLTTCSRIDINDFAGKETLANFVDRDEKEKKDNVSVVFDGKQKAAIV